MYTFDTYVPGLFKGFLLPNGRRNVYYLRVISKESSTEISHGQLVYLSYSWDFSFDDSVEMTLILVGFLPSVEMTIIRVYKGFLLPNGRRNVYYLRVISKESSTEISHGQFVYLSYSWDFSFDDSVEMTLILVGFLPSVEMTIIRVYMGFLLR